MWRPRTEADESRAARRRVKGFVWEAIGRQEEVGISVMAVQCADPACPGEETAILVAAPGRPTASCRVARPVALVTEDDVRDALQHLAYAAP